MGTINNVINKIEDYYKLKNKNNYQLIELKNIRYCFNQGLTGSTYNYETKMFIYDLRAVLRRDWGDKITYDEAKIFCDWAHDIFSRFRRAEKFVIQPRVKSGKNYEMLKTVLEIYSTRILDNGDIYEFRVLKDVNKAIERINNVITNKYDLPSYYLIIRRELWKIKNRLEKLNAQEANL